MQSAPNYILCLAIQEWWKFYNRADSWPECIDCATRKRIVDGRYGHARALVFSVPAASDSPSEHSTGEGTKEPHRAVQEPSTDSGKFMDFLTCDALRRAFYEGDACFVTIEAR